MSDNMKDILSEAIDEEIEGALEELEELEEGIMIEMDEDDLEEVAGGRKHSFIECEKDTHIRKGPGRKYKSIGHMTSGDTLRYTHESARDQHGQKWYKVELTNGKTGWVCQKKTRKEKY